MPYSWSASLKFKLFCARHTGDSLEVIYCEIRTILIDEVVRELDLIGPDDRSGLLR